MEEYLHYDSPLEGDLHELIPGKIVAFRGPQSLPDGRMYLDENGSRTFAPGFYLDAFGDMGVSTVVRLNEADYDAAAFADHGVRLVDLQFDDCSAPPAGLVAAFMDVMRGAPGTGKTSVIRALADAAGLPCETVIASIREPSDFAGLPVVERNQHSYRVGYYEPQVGFEAAVYDPGVDLKMKNDTGAALLIRAVNNDAASRLTVEVWGKKPPRTVTVSPAVILARTAHPPARYVFNPNLPAGVSKQVDWAQDGFNLYITRTIKTPWSTRTDRVDTVYKPWQAVYEYGPRAGALARR